MRKQLTGWVQTQDACLAVWAALQCKFSTGNTLRMRRLFRAAWEPIQGTKYMGSLAARYSLSNFLPSSDAALTYRLFRSGSVHLQRQCRPPHVGRASNYTLVSLFSCPHYLRIWHDTRRTSRLHRSSIRLSTRHRYPDRAKLSSQERASLHRPATRMRWITYAVSHAT